MAQDNVTNYTCVFGTLTKHVVGVDDLMFPSVFISKVIFQSSRFAPYCNKVTWPRTTLQIIHVFLLLSCPGMPGHGKVTNELFATLYKMEDS